MGGMAYLNPETYLLMLRGSAGASIGIVPLKEIHYNSKVLIYPMFYLLKGDL